MRRVGFTLALGFGLLAVPALFAQRGIELHGTPASVTSPAVDGRLRGTPASVTDPRPARISVVPNHGHHGHDGHGRDVTPVYAVPYYGYYGPAADPSQYDPSQQSQQDAQAPAAQDKLQEDSDQPEDASRYGEHYFDGRDHKYAYDEDRLVARAKPASPPTPTTSSDDSPMTTLVYRDGHKLEIRNYAIVGGNLIDLTKSPVLKKIPLDSLDLVATRKENEDNGVDFHTP